MVWSRTSRPAALPSRRALACAGGATESCLGQAAIAFLETHRSAYGYDMPLANGVAEYPGAPLGGEAQPDGLVAWTTGPEAPRFPLPEPASQARQWYYGNGAIRYFLARDPGYDPAPFRLADFAAQALRVSALMDATDPDLSAFARRGGRLILKEHMADYDQSPGAGIAYREAVRARMGDAALDGSARFYLHHASTIRASPPMSRPASRCRASWTCSASSMPGSSRARRRPSRPSR